MLNDIEIDLPLVAKGRGSVYRLLSRFYLKEMDLEFLKRLKSQGVIDSLNELGVDFGKVLNSKPEDKLIDELAEEYAALFIVPGGIPPYESVRLKGMLCQEPEWKTREFYKRCGLVVKEDCKTFSDHLGMELEFMGYLADKEASAWENKHVPEGLNRGDEKTALEWANLQKEFFGEHLDKWVFDFLNDMDKCAFHQFYKGVARLTRSFLEIEKEEFFKEKALV
ncbi:MAG: molecular chaperone TorD family protein [Deltaproteobacteria bacterium]|nr:molecular chaperone TorD family protein [Deltaproteobacteria bacterium]